jgi:tetratricopeptide (TPR) repeat protein
LPRKYAPLTGYSESELQLVDIAWMNLVCAEGLLGAETLDIDEVLTLFDQWSDTVLQNEKKYTAQYYQNPDRYDNSLAKFKAVNLGLTLKQDLGCGYNLSLIQSGAMDDVKSTRFFKDSRDLFLHGFTSNRRGSCASLPVLMVAIGRRCGYPLYLVACKGHLFCRWDDGKERFNIETACPGVDSKPDTYYKTWPHPSTNKELESEHYLKNLSPKEELGVFSSIRASCLQENGRYEEAIQAYEVALQAFPESPSLNAYLIHLKGRKLQ